MSFHRDGNFVLSVVLVDFNDASCFPALTYNLNCTYTYYTTLATEIICVACFCSQNFVSEIVLTALGALKQAFFGGHIDSKMVTSLIFMQNTLSISKRLISLSVYSICLFSGGRDQLR